MCVCVCVCACVCVCVCVCVLAYFRQSPTKPVSGGIVQKSPKLAFGCQLFQFCHRVCDVFAGLLFPGIKLHMSNCY